MVKDGSAPREGSSVEHVEAERKYDVVEPAGLVSLTAPFALGGSRTHHLVAEYVDTAGHALTEAGYSLRRRTGGADEGWHLKLPKLDDSRRELHAPLSAGSTVAHVPPSLRAEVGDVVGLEALVPVARLETLRTERDVLRDGEVVATLADDRVRATTPGGREQRWREVEVELAVEDPGLIDAIEEQLVAGGLRPSASASKIRRALDTGRPGGGDRDAADVVLTHLRAQLGTLQGLEQAVRRDGPDAVHRARVATRRLRSTLRTYRRLFDRQVTDPVRQEVKGLGDLLGAPRDVEVLLDRMLDAIDRLEQEDASLVVGRVRESLTRRLSAEHRASHEALVQALDSDRYERLMAGVVALVTAPPVRGRGRRPAKKVLPGIARKAERRVQRARARVQDAPDEAARLALLHEVRKKAKAARYAYDALVPVFDDVAEEASERWERVTDELGELQDTIVATSRLRDLAAAAEAADEASFTYGVLVEREQERGRAALAAAEKGLDAAPGGLER